MIDIILNLEIKDQDHRVQGGWLTDELLREVKAKGEILKFRSPILISGLTSKRFDFVYPCDIR